MNKKQVLVIHGGGFFDSREEYARSLKKETLKKEELLTELPVGWKETLQEDLGSGFEVLRPTMPSKENAKYDEWKIWFEKCLPFIDSDYVLVGHSLGGIFLARYLSEEKLTCKPLGLVMVAAPYFEATKAKGKKSKGGFFVDKRLKNISLNVSNIVIIQSDDDTIVPAAHALKFKKMLPQATLLMLKGKGHFFRGAKYPEIVESIRTLGN